ncbi:MAG TPA: glycoside hydrolase family 44 protein [Candidatus Sulfopaludibacter sp.]|nr:glycoside hydrolase family 44 protein [Candidatus Sulfopaludibacter sp.]
MRDLRCLAGLLVGIGCIWTVGCGGSSGGTQPPVLVTPTVTVTPGAATVTTAQDLTVSVKVTGGAGNSTPTGSVILTAGAYTSTASALGGGAASIKVTAGSLATGTVTLSAKYTPDTAGAATYNSASGTASVTVNKSSGVTSITVTPNSATIGATQQFSADVAGTGTFDTTVTWSVGCPTCGSALSAGSISAAGLYVTPYPAPASVTVTATSTQDTTMSGSVTVALNAPATTAGPALTVDAGNATHSISPDIYGMNGWGISAATARAVSLPVDRWGGDATSRYNYKLDVTNSASDWYFENNTSGSGVQDTGAFNAQVAQDASIGTKTMGTVPVLGWVAKNGTTCSFPVSAYPNQTSIDPYGGSCGNGVYPQGVSGCTDANGCNVTGNDATKTSQAVGPSWTSDWVTYLVSKFGKAADGGVAIYDLDNEPAWWDAVHRDVHPLPSTYDEVTSNGIATAKAIKNVDATAAVSGPVVDFWWNYFYSKKDIENGWGNGAPCFEPWANPTDRTAHGGTPFIEYYLQQFNAAETGYGARLLDYLDLHTYFAATYNGSGVGLTTAGDTAEQEARVNSTRVFWDPTYTDPNYAQPNYVTDANYTSNCNTPLQSPKLIPMAQKWVADDYPGTKIAFTEYNWGGQENINGAVAQADVLGIFGSYGLDLATLWGPPDPATQVPGLMAFEMYRNYDGKNAMFGDTSLQSQSSNQGKLSVYGAVRASDGALTIMVINKTYGPLTATLSLAHFTSSGTTAQVYQYSNADLTKIVAQPVASITAPSGGGTTSTITGTFPGQSLTLLVAPK